MATGRPIRTRPVPRSFRVQEERVNTHITTRSTTTTTQRQTRTGTQQIVREQIDTQSLGNRLVRRETIQFLRERNIEFTAKRMKPNTRVYAFFDETAITPFVYPKLLNVSLVNEVLLELVKLVEYMQEEMVDLLKLLK